MIQFFVFLSCLFLTYALYLIATQKTEARRELLRRRLQEALLHSRSNEEEVQLVRQEMMSEIPWMNRALLNVPLATRLKRLIDQADLHITVTRLFLFAAVAGLLAVLAVSMISRSLLGIVASGLLAAALPFVHVVWSREKRMKKFLEYLPDALDLMSRALAAGHTFPETLHMVAEEMPDPVAAEFRKTYEEQNLGLSLKLALENLAERVPLIDLRLCVTAVLIQRETGGNLGEILDKVAHTIRDRFRIMEELNTLTTQSRLGSYILISLPIFVALGLNIINPDYMSILWQDPLGQRMIAVALLLQAAGIIAVRRIMRIRV
jgi:tight adherence protein B